MWKAHFGDPQLPKPWPLYLRCLRCLPVSPAQISGWAHFWPSWTLAWNANKSDLAQNAPAYPELSFTGQTRVLSPPAFSGSCRFLKPPRPLLVLYSLQSPSMFHPWIPSERPVCAEDPEKLLVDEKLLHLWDITAWLRHVWLENSKADVVKLRIYIAQWGFFFFFFGHVEWKTWESGEKPESSLTEPLSS